MNDINHEPWSEHDAKGKSGLTLNVAIKSASREALGNDARYLTTHIYSHSLYCTLLSSRCYYQSHHCQHYPAYAKQAVLQDTVAHCATFEVHC